MWARVYNKQGELSQSVQLNDNGDTLNYYSVNGNELIKYNVWDGEKNFSYEISGEDLELFENRVGAKFFMGLAKNRKKGTIVYPKESVSRFTMVNGGIDNFNINKDKLDKWTRIAKNKTFQRRIKNI